VMCSLVCRSVFKLAVMLCEGKERREHKERERRESSWDPKCRRVDDRQTWEPVEIKTTHTAWWVN